MTTSRCAYCGCLLTHGAIRCDACNAPVKELVRETEGRRGGMISLGTAILIAIGGGFGEFCEDTDGQYAPS
jgi:hypothetical protein